MAQDQSGGAVVSGSAPPHDPMALRLRSGRLGSALVPGAAGSAALIWTGRVGLAEGWATIWPVGLLGLLFLGTAVYFGVRARRTSVVVGPPGLWLASQSGSPPSGRTSPAELVPWAGVRQLVLFAATADAGNGLAEGRRGAKRRVRRGTVLAVHRTAPERRITLPPGVEDSVVQLSRLSPSLADLVEDAVGVEDQVALRWVRGGRERDRSRLATAVARWAPHVPVVLGPPQDLRLKLGPAFTRAAVEVWRLARASKRAGTSPPPR